MPEIVEHSQTERLSKDVTTMKFWWTVLWDDGTEEHIPMPEMGTVMLYGPKHLPLEMRKRFYREMERIN